MGEQIVRLSGIRQGLGIASLIVVALLVYQYVSGTPAIPNINSLLQAILGAAMLVWAAEEYSRGNRVFTIVFLIVGLGCIATALYLFLRHVSA
jgi:hypothetical protein